VLTSKDAHYSIKKACFLLGIGVSNLYLVDVDTSGRMDLVHLRQEVQRALNENARPFMVSATAGKYEMITRIQHLINIILHA
jgi:glutamate/tyrosine decarboxylase-like PLP-dependent enzyme